MGLLKTLVREKTKTTVVARNRDRHETKSACAWPETGRVMAEGKGVKRQMRLILRDSPLCSGTFRRDPVRSRGG